MANIDLNISPYFDDFDPNKDFLRVLYRPGFPVQARELTTLQTFMQNQVQRFGNHIFKDGSRVTEGGLAVHKNVHRLFLSGSGNASFPIGNARVGSILADINTLTNKIITNNDGSVRARVLTQPSGTVGTSNVGNLFIEYITEKEFAVGGDFIYATINDNPDTVTSELVNTFSSVSPSCLAKVVGGVYYVNGFFTRLPEQSVVLSNTSHTPSAKLGFRAEQVVITQNQDASLYDNARGSTNEGAPGAHRLKQNLTFATLNIDAVEDETFYRVATIRDGVLVETVKGNPEYSDLGDTLARRTYDESGNYSVKPFPITISDEDSEQYSLRVGKSKAYVQGYEVELVGPVTHTLDKNTDFVRTSNFSIPFDNITNFRVSSYSGTLPGQTGSDPYTYANRLVLKNSAGNAIGVARGYGFFDSKIYLYDVKMFQVIKSSSSLSLSDGNDLICGRNIGYVYNADGQAGITGNSITIINFSGKFRTNQNLSSTVASIGSSITCTSSQIFSLNDVNSITGAGGFTCSIVPDSLENPNPSLLKTLSAEIKTLKGAAAVFDNDFNIVEDTGLSSGDMNGYWNVSRVDDQEEIEKNLQFKYLRIRNTGSSARTGVNFGWSVQDKQISLAYPDVYKVYKITQGTNSTFDTCRFDRINITTADLIPQGSKITGASSGTVAMVALQNATATNTQTLSSTVGYHTFETGTGDTSSLEIVYLTGTSFTANEILKVEVPAGLTAYTAPVVFNSSTSIVGKDITGMFDLDNGQRNEFYDVGRLIRKNGKSAPPEGDVVVFFSYFTASPINNFYYSADSYRKLNYYKDDVRFYNEQKPIGVKTINEGTDLRNSIDFRFRVNEPVTGSMNITDSPFIFTNRTFFKQPRIKPNSVFTTDFDEYQSNISSVNLTKSGALIIKKGNPAVFNPKKPDLMSDAMTLAYLTIPGGLRYPEQEISIEIVDNKRYTMRDIGKIEDRINRLEETVSLSLLESQALHDDLAGRSKSGFVVDDFSLSENNPNSSADQNHVEYNASIDVIDNVLIPGQTDGEQIPITVSSRDNIDDYFYNNENIIIKKYNQVALVEQLSATGCHKINPFATWIFVGELILTPKEHHWRDKVNSYFTNFFGDVRPFAGDSDQFSQFLRITTASPGGSSTSRLEWFGAPGTTSKTDINSSTSGLRTTINLSTTEVTRQSRRKITTTKFGAPRIINGTKPTTTMTGSEVIENLQDYWMRNPDGGVGFKAYNLRPNTVHELIMGGKVIIPSITSLSDGSITGNFNIPYQTYKAGEEIVSLRDKALLGKASSANAVFKSVGHKDYFETSVDVDDTRIRTENLGIVEKERTTTTETVTVTVPPPPPPQITIINNTINNTIIRNNTIIQNIGGGNEGDGGGGGGDNGDPIAQLFSLPTVGSPTIADILSGNAGGTIPNSILTSIDLWLCHIDTRSVMNKIKVEIRETVNGYPGGPDKIIGDTGWVNLNKSMEVATPTATNGTNFRFKRPVVCKGNTEYAIVIKSPSDLTEVFVAEIGQKLLDGSGIHDTQPNVGGYFGSFFVSQNQTTWNAEQNIDLAFKIYRADFDINGNGIVPTSTVIFKNPVTDLKIFKADIGAYNRGLAIETFKDSNYVRIYHPNHGMHFNNASVKLSGFDKFGTPNTYNGIPDSELNATHSVYFATLDSYFVKTTTKATSTGFPPVPVFDTFATQPVVFDSMVNNINVFKTQETDTVKLFFTGYKTNSLDLNIGSNKIFNNALANVSQGTEFEIENNNYNVLEEPYIVRNLLNSTSNDYTLKVELYSGDTYTSPMFKVDDSIYPVVFRNVTGNLLNDSDIESLTTTSITSSSTDDVLQQYTSRLAAIKSEEEFSAYVTKQIDLEIPADGFTIKFDADMEPSSKLEFAYKARQKGDVTPFEEIAWTDFNASQFITEENNGPFTSDTDFKEFTVSADVPFEFNAFKIRIRMITKNEAQISKIKDLRIIADL